MSIICTQDLILVCTIDWKQRRWPDYKKALQILFIVTRQCTRYYLWNNGFSLYIALHMDADTVQASTRTNKTPNLLNNSLQFLSISWEKNRRFCSGAPRHSLAPMVEAILEKQRQHLPSPANTLPANNTQRKKARQVIHGFDLEKGWGNLTP